MDVFHRRDHGIDRIYGIVTAIVTPQSKLLVIAPFTSSTPVEFPAVMLGKVRAVRVVWLRRGHRFVRLSFVVRHTGGQVGSDGCHRLVVVTPHQVNRVLLVRRRNELVHVLAVCASSVNETQWKEKVMSAKTKP